MGLNIKNARIEAMASQVARLAGETKTAAIGRALEERLARLTLILPGSDRSAELRRFMETEIWATIPAERLGGPPLSKDEENALLGYDEQT